MKVFLHVKTVTGTTSLKLNYLSPHWSYIKESGDDYNVILRSRDEEKKSNKPCRASAVTLIFTFANVCQIFSSNQTTQTHVNSYSMCYIELLFH